MDISQIQYVHGIPEQFRLSAALLYEDAFGKKFSAAVRSRASRIELLAKSFHLDFALGAITENSLLGIAGYHSPSGSLTGGMTYRELISQLGFLRGNWAAVIFSVYERTSLSDELLMDGIAVDEKMRGQGIGSKLLDNIASFAAAENFKTIRLDVIDTNPDAKSLYERHGFIVTKSQKFGYLKWLLGFGGSSTLIRTV